MPGKILFLVPYPLDKSPSQRFRFEQYFSLLKENGMTYTVQSFLDSHNWHLFYKPGKNVSKLFALLKGFAKRWFILPRAPFYDFVFIHREATPLGPPLMEWLLAKLFRLKIIYDFDDAIWLTDRTHESWLLRLVKWRSKVGSTCHWAYKVSCGNAYLRSFASTYNQQACYIPTTIDTEHWHNPARFKNLVRQNPEQVVIGWTGSHSTLKYLTNLEPVLQKIEAEFAHVRIMIIADQKPSLSLKSLLFVPWNKTTEVDDLMKMDIGIMPLPDDEWSKGKCGFKALQYMALGIPAVVSPVGVNIGIVDHTINGFLASTQEEWHSILRRLIVDEQLRKEIGGRSREKIKHHYSVSSNSSSFLSLFE